MPLCTIGGHPPHRARHGGDRRQSGEHGGHARGCIQGGTATCTATRTAPRALRTIWRVPAAIHPAQGVGSHSRRSFRRPYGRALPLRTPPTPSPRCRCPIRRALRPAAPLAARGGICSTTTAHVIRYRRALPFLPCPWARHHAGANTSPTCATSCARSARRWRSSLPTTPRRLPAHPPPSLTPACAARAMVVPHRRHRFYRLLMRQVHLQQVPLSSIHTPVGRLHARPLACSTCSSRSPSPAPRRRTSPPAAPVFSASLSCARSQLLCGTGSMTRSIARVRSKCNAHSPSPTPPSSPPRAPRLSSAPTLATARSLGLPRTVDRTGTISRAQHTLQLSPHRPISSPFPPSILSPIPPRSLMTPPGGFPSPAPAAFAAMTVPRAGVARTTRRRCAPRVSTGTHSPSALGISDKRGWGTATILGATNLPVGEDSRTYAPPPFRIAPPPVQFERCEHGAGYCANAGEVPNRTHITYTSRFLGFPFSFTSAIFFTL
ncbi:hypothetical protein B0H14DRAFT_3900170 [Mycena olivaceomarginata]|nr:hypothetical protein B0H14DRAFT_3900170 [Mycena olivaceomarginata]